MKHFKLKQGLLYAGINDNAESILTTQENALLFHIGYDNPQIKIAFLSAVLGGKFEIEFCN
jgi:hypothetical protein